MHKALEKIAFLPFGLLIDQWRWNVFSGKIAPGEYNKAWWELRLKYQGVAPPLARSEAGLRSGSEVSRAANTPYARYFLADVLQFQFHRGAVQAVGYKGPLHRCSIYNNKVAGARLNKMLEMGKSRHGRTHWRPLTGSARWTPPQFWITLRRCKKWLDEQNAGEKQGWDGMDGAIIKMDKAEKH